MALAFYHPNSNFTGIDLSKRAIADARYSASLLGLKNINFLLRDICNLKPSESTENDYIIAHGLFSWVPNKTKEAVLRFCQDTLASDGLAYISYNAQPGWTTRRLIRDIFLTFPETKNTSIKSKAKIAKELASKLKNDLPRNYAHGELLATELEHVIQSEEYYVFHEYLTEYNDGFWLSEFVEQANKYGLDYVADAQFCRPEGQIPRSLKQSLAKQNLSQVEQEERADLLCGRFFHASILCRKDALKSPVDRDTLMGRVYIATCLRPTNDPIDLTHGLVQPFLGQQEQEITLDAAITKSAVLLLSAQWPFGMKLDRLFSEACKLLNAHDYEVEHDARSQLLEELKILFESGVVDLRLWEPPQYTLAPSKPKLHALARYELDCGRPLTTPYHLPLQLDSHMLEIARTLDGTVTSKEIQADFKIGSVDQTVDILTRWGLLESCKNDS